MDRYLLVLFLLIGSEFYQTSAADRNRYRLNSRSNAASTSIRPAQSDIFDSGWLEVGDDDDERFGGSSLIPGQQPQMLRTDGGSVVYILPNERSRRGRSDQEETIEEILRLFDKLETQGRNGYIPGITAPMTPGFIGPYQGPLSPPPPPPPPPPPRLPFRPPFSGPFPVFPQPFAPPPPPPPYYPPPFFAQTPFIGPGFPAPFGPPSGPRPDSDNPRALFRGPGGPLIVNPEEQSNDSQKSNKKAAIKFTTQTMRSSPFRAKTLGRGIRSEANYWSNGRSVGQLAKGLSRRVFPGRTVKPVRSQEWITSRPTTRSLRTRKMQ